MKKIFHTIGEVLEYEYITGSILALNYGDDTCTLDCQGITHTDVPIFYHCNQYATERSNGALTGGSWAFGVGDDVVVLQQRPGFQDKMFVIGYKDGIRKCAPVVCIYSTESGSEAVAWDIINNTRVSDIDTLVNIQSLLTSYSLSDQTECTPEDLRVYCFSGLGINPQQHESDLPVYSCDLEESPPFIAGSIPFVTLLDYPHEGSTCGDDHFAQTYYTNPVTTKSQIPRPGMWIATISGVIPRADWDTQEWGTCPLPSGQSWMGVEQQYLFFRSIFDYRYAGGSVVYPYITYLGVANLTLGTSLLFLLTRDGEYYHIDTDVDESIWLSSGLSQSSYDFLLSTTEAYLAGTGCPAPFHLLLPHSPMWDKCSGVATNNDVTMYFEYASVFPSVYQFFEASEVWDASMVAKLKQDFRIYYRYPFLKKNKDAMLFKFVNDVRVGLGKDPLEINHNLCSAAKNLSDDMAGRLTIQPEHISSNGDLLQDRVEDTLYSYYVHLFSEMSYKLGENVHAVEQGLKWQIERVVDNSNITIPDSYLVHATNTIRDIAYDDKQVSHDKDGNITGISGDGWKQSAGHYAIMIDDDFTEAGLATSVGIDNITYATQVFGVRGDPGDFQDEDDQFWPGFSCFDTHDLLTYVNENFLFIKTNGDERRKPRIFLCTMQ